MLFCALFLGVVTLPLPMPEKSMVGIYAASRDGPRVSAMGAATLWMSHACLSLTPTAPAWDSPNQPSLCLWAAQLVCRGVIAEVGWRGIKEQSGMMIILCHFQRRPPPPVPPAEENDNDEEEIVVAMYDFQPTECHDLRLDKGEEYTVIEKNDIHWWKARDKHG